MLHRLELRMLCAWDWGHGLLQRFRSWHQVELLKQNHECMHSISIKMFMAEPTCLHRNVIIRGTMKAR